MPSTTNAKLAVMELEQVWEPGLPLSPGTFDQADQQQLLWGYPAILWGEVVVPEPDTIALPASSQLSEALDATNTFTLTLMASSNIDLALSAQTDDSVIQAG